MINSEVKKWWAVVGSVVSECRWQFKGAHPPSPPTPGETQWPAKGLKNVKGSAVVPDIYGDFEKAGTAQPGEKQLGRILSMYINT